MDNRGRITRPRSRPSRALVAEARGHAGLKLGTLARLVAAHMGEPERVEAHRVRLHRFEKGEAASLPAHIYSSVADVLLDRLPEDEDGYRLGSLLHADRMAANLRADLARFEGLVASRQEAVDAAIAALEDMQSIRDTTRALLDEFEAELA